MAAAALTFSAARSGSRMSLRAVRGVPQSLRMGETLRRWQSSGPDYAALRKAAAATGLNELAEVVEANKLLKGLRNPAELTALPDGFRRMGDKNVTMTPVELKAGLDAALATFLLHVEARAASFVGQGFYTIGPCGEEPTGAGMGLALHPNDATALHYRHVASSVARALVAGRPLEDVLLDRARGYTVSSLDPVSGGVHCCIGGGKTEFIVTSTLASQAPPAVGRALGIPLASHLGCLNKDLSDKSISFVTVGDGSVNNAHFLAAANLAEYSQHRTRKCPVLFGVSDNGFCISLRGHNWLPEFVKRFQFPVYAVDGRDMLAVHATTKEAAEYVREMSRPALITYNNISRRFGHAATDRQIAYMTDADIKALAARDVIGPLVRQAVEAGVTTFPEVADRFEWMWGATQAAFGAAAKEPKITSREQQLSKAAQPVAPPPAHSVSVPADVHSKAVAAAVSGKPIPAADPKLVGAGKPQVMRKNMNSAIREVLIANPNAVYIGEDVIHGGYYLVTEGLAKEFPLRVHDFPPDETTLVGAAMGFAQAGMLPIIEIPYGKYLDCAADMFFEAIISNWLSNGRQPNGMIIRLQGFDRGVFGGNFHTHNSIYTPPGLDVVAYSNGADYARGLRYAVQQAKAGRVVMFVDSTDLLNQRHCVDSDDTWQKPYPPENQIMTWDEVRTYTHGTGKDVAIVTYGNGVRTAMRALRNTSDLGVTVVDMPYISGTPPKDLYKVLAGFERVVFADVCKDNQYPLAGVIARLQRAGRLPRHWQAVAAQNTYNPLGRTLTFLSEEDILEAVRHVCA